MKTPVLLCLLVALPVEAALLSLANWQYHRYQQHALQRQTHLTAHTTHLTGILNNAATVALDNQPNPIDADRIGWRLLTPLQTPSATVIIDRGWLPLPADRTAPPDFSMFVAPTVSLTLTGIPAPLPQRNPHTPGWLRGPDTTTSPRLLSFLSPGLMVSDTASVSTTTLQLTQPIPGQPPQLISLPPATPDPARNLSYCIQWLAMALAFPILCLFALRKSLRQHRR